MRKTVSGLMLLAALGVAACAYADTPTPRTGAALAQAENELVTSDAAQSADITVYGSAFAQVQESRTVTLKAGRNRVQLNGIAAKYRPDSLRLINTSGPGTFVYRSATYQPANLTSERLLAESVGKRIKAYRTVGGTKVEITGVLQSVSGASLVLQKENGALAGETELVSTADVTLLETPTGLSNTASLVLEADVTTGGDYELEFLYETNGITWSAKHSLIYDDVRSVVTNWEASVSLVNDSGTSFRNATVRLLSGQVATGDAPGGVYASPMAASVRSADFAPESAAVESVGDQKVYTLPGTLNLSAGQARQVPLFTGKNVPVKRTYIVGAVSARNYSADGKYDAQVRLTVENCEKHHLGSPIPGGAVKVYQYNAAKKLQLTGSTRVGDKAQDEIFDLNIGTSSDIKWETKVVDVKPVSGGTAGDGNDAPAPVAPAPLRPRSGQVTAPPVQGEESKFEDQTVEIKVYNYNRDRDVEVKAEVNVPVKQQLEPKWKRPRADRAETTFTVPKTGSNSVRYTIRIQVR